MLPKVSPPLPCSINGTGDPNKKDSRSAVYGKNGTVCGCRDPAWTQTVPNNAVLSAQLTTRTVQSILVSFPSAVFTVTVMVAVPGDTALTRPLLSTLATPLLSLA